MRLCLCVAVISLPLFLQAQSDKKNAAMILNLNHAFVVPAADTYRAVRTSKFMRQQFGASEERTTQRGDKTYTGLYWYGQNTYFELLQPSASDAPGSAGIAFTSDQAGTFAKLAPRYSTAKNAVKSVTITRSAPQGQVDWFAKLDTPRQMQASHLSSWIMEYTPTFLQQWYPQLLPQQQGTARRLLLERYAAKIGMSKERETGLLLDIIQIDLRLDPADLPNFNSLCEDLGLEQTLEFSMVVCRAPNLTLTAVEGRGESASAIQKVTFSLRHPKEGEQEYTFGRSKLTFSGDRAEWIF